VLPFVRLHLSSGGAIKLPHIFIKVMAKASQCWQMLIRDCCIVTCHCFQRGRCKSTLRAARRGVRVLTFKASSGSVHWITAFRTNLQIAKFSRTVPPRAQCRPPGRLTYRMKKSSIPPPMSRLYLQLSSDEHGHRHYHLHQQHPPAHRHPCLHHRQHLLHCHRVLCHIVTRHQVPIIYPLRKKNLLSQS